MGPLHRIAALGGEVDLGREPGGLGPFGGDVAVEAVEHDHREVGGLGLVQRPGEVLAVDAHDDGAVGPRSHGLAHGVARLGEVEAGVEEGGIPADGLGPLHDTVDQHAAALQQLATGHDVDLGVLDRGRPVVRGWPGGAFDPGAEPLGGGGHGVGVDGGRVVGGGARPGTTGVLGVVLGGRAAHGEGGQGQQGPQVPPPTTTGAARHPSSPS